MRVSFESFEKSLPCSNAAIDNVFWFINRTIPFGVDILDVSPAKDAAVVAKIGWAHFNAAPASNAVERALVADVFCSECFFCVLADFDNAVVSHNAVPLFFKLLFASLSDHDVFYCC